MSIPLNIDTPTGVEYTINKTIRVCSSGRILLRVATESAQADVVGATVHLKLLNNSAEVNIEIPVKVARLFAYDILAKTEK